MIPINKMGPKNAVIDAESREEATMTNNFNRFKFTPKLCAYEVPKEFPMRGFMVLKQINNPIKTKIDKT